MSNQTSSTSTEKVVATIDLGDSTVTTSITWAEVDMLLSGAINEDTEDSDSILDMPMRLIALHIPAIKLA